MENSLVNGMLCNGFFAVEGAYKKDEKQEFFVCFEDCQFRVFPCMTLGEAKNRFTEKDTTHWFYQTDSVGDDEFKTRGLKSIRNGIVGMSKIQVSRRISNNIVSKFMRVDQIAADHPVKGMHTHD